MTTRGGIRSTEDTKTPTPRITQEVLRQRSNTKPRLETDPNRPQHPLYSLQKFNRTKSVLYLAINDDTQVSGVALTGIVSNSFFKVNILAPSRGSRVYDHLTRHQRHKPELPPSRPPPTPRCGTRSTSQRRRAILCSQPGDLRYRQEPSSSGP